MLHDRYRLKRLELYDVLVVGGGPAGSTVATLLAQHGLRVAIFERARSPRFHIGESLLPANVPIFERLGCHDALRRAGFLVKPGASFYDEYEGRGTNTLRSSPTPFSQPLPTMLCGSPLMISLPKCCQAGCAVNRQHTVRHPRIEPDKVVVQVSTPQGTQQTVQARSSGRCERTLSAARRHVGQRELLPDLGKERLRAFSGSPARPNDSRRQYSHPPRTRRLDMVDSFC